MSDVGLFILGVLITLPAAAGIVGLLYAAVLDGRENDRITAQLKQDDTSGQTALDRLASR